MPDAKILVLNLGSRYAGWIQDVCDLLGPLERPEALEQAVPNISLRRVVERVRELRYICLAGRLSITETRKAFAPVPPGEVAERNEYLDGLLARMRDAPLRDHEQDRAEDEHGRPEDEEEPEEDFPWNSNVDPVDDRGASRQPPHYGGHQGRVEVIVDCYGIYVESWKRWLDGVASRAGNQTIRLWRERLEADPEADGPAVLLCPELIETVHRLVMSRAPLAVRKQLGLGTVPTRTFLKMVLLHEIGHHIYPVHRAGAVRLLPEALANWFTYGLLDSGQRALLYEKTAQQEEPYRMYNGLLAVRHTPIWLGLVPWPPFGGPETIACFEQAAFSGQLPDGRAIWPFEMDVVDWLRHWRHLSEFWFPWRSRRGAGRAVHPAEVMGLVLLCEAFPRVSHEVARVVEFAEEHLGRLRPMSQQRQRRWLERLWRLPRVF